MRLERRIRLGAWLGFWLAAVMLAGSYVIEKILHIPLLPYVLFDWLTTHLPGNLVTWGLDTMIAIVRFFNFGRTSDVGKTAERLLALLLVLGAAAMLGAGFGAWVKTRQRALLAALIPLLPSAALMLWFGNIEGWKALNVMWIAGMWLAWGAALQYLLARLDVLPDQFGESTPENPRDALMTRRIFLNNVSVRMIGVAFGLSAFRWLMNGLLIENDLASVALARDDIMPRRDEDFAPTPETRPEVSPIDDFYVIDKNTFPPNVDAAAWRLVVDGRVENPMQYTYDDILNMPAVDFYATLMCISNNVGGDLIDNTMFTGIPLARILDAAGLQAGVREIKFYSADGYYETLPLDSALLDETVLCYGMGRETLAVQHGFPLRLYTPHRYGMKNPKWIERIEAVGDIQNGYWTDRGWAKEAFIKMTTIIDGAVADTDAGTIGVGGIAFSGARGISKVEVRLGGGAWREADLRTPISPLSWVQWRADIPYDADDGDTVEARCWDGDGAAQIAERRDSRPDGASGYDQFKIG